MKQMIVALATSVAVVAIAVAGFAQSSEAATQGNSANTGFRYAAAKPQTVDTIKLAMGPTSAARRPGGPQPSDTTTKCAQGWTSCHHKSATQQHKSHPQN